MEQLDKRGAGEAVEPWILGFDLLRVFNVGGVWRT